MAVKAEFVVVIEGNWLINDQRVTAAKIEKALRSAVKEEFEFLASKATVKRKLSSEVANSPSWGKIVNYEA